VNIDCAARIYKEMTPESVGETSGLWTVSVMKPGQQVVSLSSLFVHSLLTIIEKKLQFITLLTAIVLLSNITFIIFAVFDV